MRSYVKVMALVLILVLALVSLQLGCSGNDAIPSPTPTEPTPSPAPTPAEPTPSPTPSPTPTPLEPKVTIVIYTDYQCHVCAGLHDDVEAKLLSMYVYTGKAELEIRLLPGLGPESLRASEATLCAASQEKFWDYRDAILAAWREADKDAYSEEQLKEVATEVGLDMAAFSTCLDSGAKRAEVQGYHNQAIADDVREIPKVLINGVVVTGAKPLEVYVEIIEEQLAKSM